MTRSGAGFGNDLGDCECGNLPIVWMCGAQLPAENFVKGTKGAELRLEKKELQ